MSRSLGWDKYSSGQKFLILVLTGAGVDNSFSFLQLVTEGGFGNRTCEPPSQRAVLYDRVRCPRPSRRRLANHA